MDIHNIIDNDERYNFQHPLGLAEPIKNSIIFQEPSTPEPVMIISKGKFYALGKEIEDVHGVYEKMLEWLNKANVVK